MGPGVRLSCGSRVRCSTRYCGGKLSMAGREVSMGTSHSFGALPIGFSVSIGQQMGVLGVRPRQGMRMPDRAEALFRSRGDFNDIGEQAVGIGAINTAHLLERVQVGQAPSIEDQIISPLDL